MATPCHAPMQWRTQKMWRKENLEAKLEIIPSLPKKLAIKEGVTLSGFFQ
jgi:hypothetical protein